MTCITRRASAVRDLRITVANVGAQSTRVRRRGGPKETRPAPARTRHGAMVNKVALIALEISREQAQARTDALSKQSLAVPRAAQTCASCRRQMFTSGYARRNAAKSS